MAEGGEAAAVSLADQVRAFAGDLTSTVHAIASSCAPFRSLVLDENARFQVSQDPVSGIPLTVAGEEVLKLVVTHRCCFDGAERYLAVEESRVNVFSRISREPLFRFDYDRSPIGGIPGAHIQVHAHRDALSHALTLAGRGSRRGKKRSSGDTLPELKNVHFPVGGHRFRPCLEDVLEFLTNELGVDTTAEGRAALQEGRERWRRQQTRAVVRDAPEEACEILRSLGYEIIAPTGGHYPTRLDRLREI